MFLCSFHMLYNIDIYATVNARFHHGQQLMYKIYI